MKTENRNSKVKGRVKVKERVGRVIAVREKSCPEVNHKRQHFRAKVKDVWEDQDGSWVLERAKARGEGDDRDLKAIGTTQKHFNQADGEESRAHAWGEVKDDWGWKVSKGEVWFGVENHQGESKEAWYGKGSVLNGVVRARAASKASDDLIGSEESASGTWWGNEWGWWN